MIVVAYDIPELQKSTRQKFRRQLQRWGFQPVQKSVWETENLLPIGFTKMLKHWRLTDSVKVYFTSVPKSRL